MTAAGSSTRASVAVVGAGVSGLTAAYLLSRRYDVTLYESDPRLGGHAHTHDVTDADGHRLTLDTGFIVHNDTTYPLLRRLFGELGISTRPAEMSMSIRDERTGWEYAGGRGLRGVFAQPRRGVDRKFWPVLAQVRRFHLLASAFLRVTDDSDQTTYGDFLRRRGFSSAFTQMYAVPVVSCVWSMSASAALDYPARYLFRFLDRHGMLQLSDSAQWFTVIGGSRTYVDAVAKHLHRVRCGNPVVAVLREPDGVWVRGPSGTPNRHDKVVIATHADQALGLLADASPEEKSVLGAFAYTRNDTVLHTDTRLLPEARQARASWNYLVPAVPDGDRPVLVTYWLNRLQALDSPDQYLVTLNGRERIDPDRVVASMTYEHPVYDLAAVRAQRRLADLTTDTTAFAGAYHGWGFHEDGCRSGVAAAHAFGVAW